MDFDFAYYLVYGLVILVVNYFVTIQFLPKLRYKTVLKKWYENNESNESFTYEKWRFKNLPIAALFPAQFISGDDLDSFTLLTNSNAGPCKHSDFYSLHKTFDLMDKGAMFLLGVPYLILSGVFMTFCIAGAELFRSIKVVKVKNISKDDIKRGVLINNSIGVGQINRGDWSESDLTITEYVSVIDQE